MCVTCFDLRAKLSVFGPFRDKILFWNREDPVDKKILYKTGMDHTCFFFDEICPGSSDHLLSVCTFRNLTNIPPMALSSHVTGDARAQLPLINTTSCWNLEAKS